MIQIHKDLLPQMIIIITKIYRIRKL